MPLPRIAQSRRAAPVLICRKCLKRSDDAKAIKKAIKRTLKSEGEHGTGTADKPARVVMTSCFGLCPKRAVVITGRDRAARGEYVLLSSPADVAGALQLLTDAQEPSS
ncbi:hypothetical protein ACQR1I_32640 [Bradyrhizobium sp. HKCCYLS2038]|uniref:hypothetical protein n=1 Tax=unclassified Bradyrhizobium TaxID=2631580 RepID=UPI003EB8B456